MIISFKKIGFKLLDCLDYLSIASLHKFAIALKFHEKSTRGIVFLKYL